jgi:hypothetical protein
MCHPSADLPIDMRPSVKDRGEVVVDAAHTSGLLVMNNNLAYNFPA